MKIKTLIITALMILPLFAAGCSDSSDSKAGSVKIDLSGAAITESMSSIFAIQPVDSEISGLPGDINTLEIIVKNGNDIVYNHSFSRDVIVDASNTITLDIPAGNGLVFTVNGFDIGNTWRYTGSSDPVDITAGTEITIQTIILKPVVLTMDANFTINLKDINGNTFNTPVKTYFNQTIVDVLTVNVTTVNNETTVTSQSIDSTIYPKSYSPTTTELKDLVAYPGLFQFILVKTVAADGTIAAIGAAIKSTLVSNDNAPFDIKMVPPGRLNITNISANLPYTVEIFFEGAYRTVESGTTSGNSQLILIPNSRNGIGKVNPPEVTSTLHNIRITVNGVTKTNTSFEINWKQVDVDFQNNPSWVL